MNRSPFALGRPISPTRSRVSRLMFLHLDCRHYLGDRPCRYHRLCEGCPHYTPMGPRVLIVKLGALGDVVRTACLLPGLEKWSEAPFVTWLTAPGATALVRRMPGVHRVLPFDGESLALLDVENFDYVFSIDKEPAPCAAAMRARADVRRGIGLSRYGTVFPLNDECEEYFRLGLDDPFKFHENQKTYPNLIYEALGLDYRGEEYRLATTEADRAAADRALAAAGARPGETLIGINPGAGHVFANKAWREGGYARLLGDLGGRPGSVAFVMLGGREESDLVTRIAREAGGARVLLPGTDHPLGTFAALVERCAVTVSGDTLAMHLALALGRRSVAIFGPTCAQEIDMFGRGEKIVTPIDCAPCYLRRCDKSPNCQDRIQSETVAQAVERQLAAARDQPAAPRTPAVEVTDAF